MKRVLKWAALVVGVLGVAGFLAFLYFIPPFTTTPPEAFIEPEAKAPPPLDQIADPGTRALAERGRDIVVHTGCIACHQVPGPQGPQFDYYLAGGMKFITKSCGTMVSRNLTPDPETGIGKRTDEDLLRVLRSGIFHDGRVMSNRGMVWDVISHLTEEDRYAIVVFLRQLRPVHHPIPDPDESATTVSDPNGSEEDLAGKDYGLEPPKK